MSTQSILVKSVDTIKNEIDKKLLINAEKYILKKKIELGKGVNKKLVKHQLRILSFICTENCELINSINNQIEGKKQDNSFEPKFRNIGYTPVCNADQKITSKQEDTLYRIWLSRGNTGSIEEFLDVVLENDRVEWTGELKW